MSVEAQKAEDASARYWRTVRIFDVLRSMHNSFYDQVKTADQKAGYICTFLTILFAYSKEHGHVLLFLKEAPNWSIAWILSIVFAAAASYSIVCTLLVFLPRSSSEASSFYWGTWANAGIPKERLLEPDIDDFLLTEYVKDVRNLSRICQAKYKYVNRAFRGTATTILCFVAIMLTRQ